MADASPTAVEVELASDRSLSAVCRLVAAGVAGRHDVTVDRIDELQLAIDVALRQPAAARTLSMRVTPTGDDLRFEIGPFAIGSSARDHLERVLSVLVAGATTRDIARKTWVEMRVPLPEAERG